MQAWQRDAPVRLLHKDTGAFLSTHAVKYQRCVTYSVAGGFAVAGLKQPWMLVVCAVWHIEQGTRVLLASPCTISGVNQLPLSAGLCRPIPGHTEVMAMKTKVGGKVDVLRSALRRSKSEVPYGSCIC